MMSPSVSVVIPAYNAAMFIGEALESILSQTTPPEEVILINDGSTDNTMEIAKSYEPLFANRLLVIDQKNSGASAAHNRAIEAARCDVIAFLDADDMYFPTYIDTVKAAFTAMPDIVLFFTDTEIMDANGPTGRSNSYGKPVETISATPVNGFFRANESLFPSLVRGNYIPPCVTAVKRTTALEAGLFDPAFKTSEDRDFFCRLVLRGAVGFSRTRLAYERIHNANLSIATNRTLLSSNAVNVLRKLSRHEFTCLMRPEEQAALKSALHDALSDYAYTVSLEGFGAWVSMISQLSFPERGRLFQLRDIARAIAVSLGVYRPLKARV